MGTCAAQLYRWAAGQTQNTSDLQSKREELGSLAGDPSHFLRELSVKSPKGTSFISGNLFSTSWEIETA